MAQVKHRLSEESRDWDWSKILEVSQAPHEVENELKRLNYLESYYHSFQNSQKFVVKKAKEDEQNRMKWRGYGPFRYKKSTGFK
jgi:hypothetical protein